MIIYGCPIGGCGSDNSIGIIIALIIAAVVIIGIITYFVIKKIKK